MQYVVHRLARHSRQNRPNSIENRIRRGMWTRMQRFEHRNPWSGHTELCVTQLCWKVRRRGHPTTMTRISGLIQDFRENSWN